MSPTTISPFRRAWLRWKALHLPWRKRFLVGNTFWEFRDTLSSHQHRMRRIVEYPSSVHYSDIKISPQWHQWLRHTRQDAPSIAEQSQDLVRRKNLKILAAEADARWAAKPSVLDSPGVVGEHLQIRGEQAQSIEETKRGSAGVGGPSGQVQDGDNVVADLVNGLKGKEREKIQVQDHTSVTGRPEEKRRKENGEMVANPWKESQGGPSEQWQPKAWDGIAAAKR